MSFAATVALVAVFGTLRDRGVGLGPRWLRPVSAVFVSSLVAGLATAPFAAMHFNQLAHFGLPANLLSVPVMGTVVAPAAVMAALLWPVGLEDAPLWVMAQGLAWIQEVAAFFSGRDGARSFVVAPVGAVMPLLTLGAVWLVLWRNNARWVGALVMVMALGVWSQTRRPEVLISESGGLVGMMTAEGRALSKQRGDGFVAGVWLENDGDNSDQETASRLWSGTDNLVRSVALPDQKTLFHLTGKRAVAIFSGCSEGDVVVTKQKGAVDWPCTTLDAKELQKTGAIAIRFDKGERQIISARDVSGQRLWHRTLPD